MNILKIKDPQGNWVDIPALKGDKGDKGDPGISPTIDSTLSQANQAADAKVVGDKIDEITLTIDETLTQSGQVADAKVTGDALNTKANQNGYYENLNVGVADQLASKKYIEDNEAYTFRPTANGAKVGTREFDTIVGGSIVWNQLIQNGNFADAIDPWTRTSATVSVDNNIVTITSTGSGGIVQNISPKINHVILASAVIQNVNATTAMLRLNGGIDKQINTNITEWQTVSNVVKYNSVDSSTIYIRIASANQSLRVKYVNVFDLTQMFGSEIADYIYSLEQATAGAGVACFRKYFPNEYYDYNPGELIHVTDLQSHDTVGFNLIPFAPVYSQTSAILDKEKAVKVFPNQKYIFNFDGIGNATNWRIHLKFWDINGNIVGGSDNIPFSTDASVPFWASSANLWVEGADNVKKLRYYIFNRPGYVQFYFGNGTTTSNMEIKNAVFNLSGTRDGEYEPYTKHSYPLDPSLTLRGIPKLVDGKLVFDGDIYKPDGTIERRYGIVDLGTLNWVYRNSGYNVKPFLANLSGTVVPAASTIVIPAFCEKYPQVVPNKLNVSGADKIFGIGMYFSNQHNINIVDTDYTDATAFKNAMSGVYLIYPLATPTTETATPYTSPQIVDPYGTEEYVTTSLIPVGHQTQYPEDLRAKIDSLPWNFANLIAPVEATYKATQNYTAGSLFIVNNILYKATANIANGGTITPNTNCTATTLAEIIAAF